MPNNPYPTFSDSGWITDAKQKVEWIFSDYIKAKHSQSIINYGKVSSLSFDEFDGNYEGIKTADIIQRSLTKLYSAYFETADIEVTDDSLSNSETTTVTIKGILSQGGQRFQLNENLTVRDGRVIFSKR